MKFSTLCFSSVATVAALVFTPAAADGAITVFGAGPAASCFDGAEHGHDAGTYMIFCTEALNGVLTTHDRAATFINRGVLKLQLNMATDALADFDSGLALDPALGDGYVDRGATLIEKKQFAEAIQNIDKGLQFGSKRPHIAYYDRAIADEQLGDVMSAYKDYQQSLALNPGFTRASDELKRFKVIRKTGGS